MNTIDQQIYHWCQFEAHQHNSIIIEYVVLALQILIFILMIYAFIKAKKENQLDSVSEIYKYIVLWLIFFFIKTLINVVAYFTYIIQSPNNTLQINLNQNDDNQYLVLKIMSSFFFFLDLLTTFFLQNTMIYIPYLWMNNALELLFDSSHISEEGKSVSLAVAERRKIDRVYSFLEIIKKYMYFRLIYILFFILAAVMVAVSDGTLRYGKYITVISLVESVIIIGIYICASYTYNILKEKLSLKEKQKKIMFIEYVILLICNLVRIFLNSVFYFSDQVTYIPDKYCYDNHDSTQTTYNCLFLIFGLILMHIVPGSMILYVYWPTRKFKNDLRGSLLISSFQRF